MAKSNSSQRRSTRLQIMRREWQLYVFLIPGILFFLIFSYLPFLGNVVAFQDYRPFLGISGSEWVGFDNFTAFFRDREFLPTLRNTLFISLLQIVFAFPAPIILALFLNSLLSNTLKRSLQSIVYIPHFFSWVVVISIWQKIFGGVGVVASLLERIGVENFNLMSNPDTFKFLVVAEIIWKDVGWGTIIFFAAITSIPTELYEAAASDGASALRRTLDITLPALVPVISLLLILEVGSVLSVGFEQLILQQPAVGANAAQVIDTFVYYRGIAGGQWGMSTAAGLMNGVLGTILVLSSNWFAKRAGTGGII